MKLFLWQIPFASISEHKEQIEKAEEKERLRKEKEEKLKKEAEEKAGEEKSKANEEDVRHINEAGKYSDVEDNAVASNHDKIGVLDDSPADQVWLYLLFILRNLTVHQNVLYWKFCSNFEYITLVFSCQYDIALCIWFSCYFINP